MKLQRIVLSVLILVLAAGAASAGSSRGAAGEVAPLLQSPAETMQQWREGILRFVAKRSNFTSEQVAAIRGLADLEVEFFAPILDANRRGVLAERLGELGRVFSNNDYLKILRSFNDKVQVWLIDNQFTSLEESECNCSNRWDCNGNACQDVTCTHVAGTSHDGRCTGTEEF